MKVTPVASPTAIPPQGTPEHVRTARAVAAFNKAAGGGSNHAAQLNQNAIAPEDLSAIKAPAKQEETEENQDDSAQLATAPSLEDAVAAAQASEETPADAPKAETPDPALSRQFAQLARQEKAIRAKAQAQEQAFKVREAALAARETELASRQPDLSKYVPRDRVKAETLAVLAEEGVSYDDLTSQLINQVPTDPRVRSQMAALEAKIAQLEKANENSQKSYSENQQQAYDAAVKQIKTDAKRLVFTDPNFETVKATNSVNDVVELITQTYEKDGVLLSVEEAAQQVEDYLIEEATKLAQISKVQKRLQSNASRTAANQTQKPQNVQPKAQPQMKTLTNATSSQRQLSARERALLAFKGELKQG